MIIGIDLDNTIIDYTNAFKEVALKNNIIDNYWIENNKSKKLNFFKESLKKHLLKKNPYDRPTIYDIKYLLNEN